MKVTSWLFVALLVVVLVVKYSYDKANDLPFFA